MHRVRLPSGAASAKIGEIGSGWGYVQTYREGGHDRASEIDLPVEGHEQLNCLHLRVMCKLTRLVNAFVLQALDSAAEDLQRMTGFRSDKTVTDAQNT